MSVTHLWHGIHRGGLDDPPALKRRYECTGGTPRNHPLDTTQVCCWGGADHVIGDAVRTGITAHTALAETITDLPDKVVQQMLRDAVGLDVRHVRFTGVPGTGKDREIGVVDGINRIVALPAGEFVAWMLRTHAADAPLRAVVGEFTDALAKSRTCPRIAAALVMGIRDNGVLEALRKTVAIPAERQSKKDGVEPLSLAKAFTRLVAREIRLSRIARDRERQSATVAAALSRAIRA